MSDTTLADEEETPAVAVRRAPAATLTTTTPADAMVDEVDLWRSIGAELRMAPSAGYQVKNPLALFANSSRFINETSERARPFLAHIRTELERRRLPLEIALIPIIESAYNPAATSPGGAAGLWQLMPDTGRRFGLYQSRWYDGRRDVIASTTAALDYFEALRDRFMGDWKLVFAAYNCGERTVERAIERNARLGKRTDYRSLTLPRSTREYVPKLLALVEIIANPEAYNVKLAKIPSTPYFETIDVGSALDLNRVIDWSDMVGAEFDFLNAGFRKRFTVDAAPSRVLIPVARAESVRRALAQVPVRGRQHAAEHLVKAGETLSHISISSGVSIAALKQFNGLRSNQLAVGQKILIPQPGAVPAVSDAEPSASRSSSSPRVHQVRSGDNLWDIARSYRTTVAALAQANGIDKSASLRVGQKLKIPTRGDKALAVTTPPVRTHHYEVQPGDSLWTISRRFNVTIAELKRWNGLAGKQRLQPGQRLVVRGEDYAT